MTLGLRYLLLQLVNRFPDVRHVIRELALGAMVAEQLDLAVADLGSVIGVSGGRPVRWEQVRLGAKPHRDALNALGMAEVGGKEVEADGNVALDTRPVHTGSPDDGEAVE